MKVKEISEQLNFKEYLEALSAFARRYTVLIAAADTAVGFYYTAEHQKLLNALGLKCDLVEQYRLGYVAVIDEGKVLLEKLAKTPEEIVEEKVTLKECEIELTSVCFSAPRGNCALLKIDGKNYSPSIRGLNIVVFDKVTGFLLDAVNFDTFSESFACHRPQQMIDGVNKFLETHPGVSFVCFNRPDFPAKNRTKNEEFIISNSIGRATILNNLDKPLFAIQNYYNPEGIKAVLNAPKAYHDINGVRKFEDVQGEYVNTIGGHRLTTDQPTEGKRTIFLLGGCHIFGVGASDQHTTASFLQKLLNRSLPQEKFVVQNYGYYLMEVQDAKSGEELAILNDLPVKPGDIILWNFSPIPELPFINMSQSSYAPREHEIFTDTMHMTPDGYLLMAKELFKGLMELDLLREDAKLLEKRAISGNYKAAGGGTSSLGEGAGYGFSQS